METRDHGGFDDEVGRLVFFCTDHPTETPSRPILRNDQFDIGRKDFEQLYGINELTLSTHHVRFRCVLFDGDPNMAETIVPMVYVQVLSANPVQVLQDGAVIDDEAHTIHKDDADFLLSNGDVLQLTPKTSVLFSAEDSYLTESRGLNSIRKAETALFSDQYLVTGRKLGLGGQASVFVAVKQSVGRQVACKIVARPTREAIEKAYFENVEIFSESQQNAAHEKTDQLLRQKQDEFVREYTILKELDHPNIISLDKVICATYNVYIFQELITGGDLMSYIDKNGMLGEAQSAVITSQLLKAVEYLHRNGIVHRDIKPDNILMTSSREGCRIVLTDFGQSRTHDEAKAARNKAVTRMQTKVGTYGYLAPEVLQQVRRDLQEEGYSKAIDIWSIGCITAILLTSIPLFRGPSFDKLEGRAPSEVYLEQSWDLSVIDHGKNWARIGRKAKSFVKGCLVIDETERLTAKQALLHPWFTNKHYAAEMEAACERAIQDWKPRGKRGDLVEHIDTTDSIPLRARRKHAERLAEEVKSRYFEDPPPAAPTFSAFPPNNQASQRTRFHTPLPGIGEDISSDGVEVPASPSVTQMHYMLTNEDPDAEYTEFANGLAYGTMDDFSINEFAPPATEFSPPVNANHPLDLSGSPTQSQ